MPEQRSLIESFSPRGGGYLPRLLGIRPVVLDSSFLVQDVRRAAQAGQSTPFLESLQVGIVRGFAGTHIWAEMPRVLSNVAGGRFPSHDRLEAVWWDHYVPWIRFVEVDGLPIPHCDRIQGRDASDAPTLALAELLRPVVVLAADRDLRDLGVAPENWWAMAEYAGTMTTVAQGGWAGMVSMNVGFYATGGAVRGVVRLARMPLVQLIVLAAAVAALLTFPKWNPSARARIGQLARSARSFADTNALPWLAEIGDLYGAASSAWDGAVFAGEGQSLIQNVSHHLATSPHPMTQMELAAALWPAGTGAERRRLVLELGELCRSAAPLVATDNHRWQLGRSGVDFGGRTATPLSLRRRLPSLPRLQPASINRSDD
jgi:hypothetical protein